MNTTIVATFKRINFLIPAYFLNFSNISLSRSLAFVMIEPDNVLLENLRIRFFTHMEATPFRIFFADKTNLTIYIGFDIFMIMRNHQNSFSMFMRTVLQQLIKFVSRLFIVLN